MAAGQIEYRRSLGAPVAVLGAVFLGLGVSLILNTFSGRSPLAPNAALTVRGAGTVMALFGSLLMLWRVQVTIDPRAGSVLEAWGPLGWPFQRRHALSDFEQVVCVWTKVYVGHRLHYEVRYTIELEGPATTVFLTEERQQSFALQAAEELSERLALPVDDLTAPPDG